jgi:hypothetical protein
VPLKGAVGIGNCPAAGVSGVNLSAAHLARLLEQLASKLEQD